MRVGRWLVPMLALAACSQPVTEPGVGTTTEVSTTATTTTVPATTHDTTPPTAAPLVTSFPDVAACEFATVPETGEVVMTVGTRLFGSTFGGTTVRCLFDGVDPDSPPNWGPFGDRFLVGREAVLAGSEPFVVIDEEPTSPVEWTTPTGLRLVYASAGRLIKSEVDGTGSSDIGWLADTVEVAYHPAGTHYLVTGTDVNGVYGLWLARNDASTTILVATDVDAKITSPGWTADGEIVFVADHQGYFDLHRIFPSQDLGSYEQMDLVTTDQWLGHVTPSPFNPALIAFAQGGDLSPGCSEGRGAMVFGVDLPPPLTAMISLPIGWLPDDRLVIAAFPDGCGGPLDVWILTSGFCPGTEYGAALLATGVGSVSTRVTMPPPPPAPDDFSDLPDPAPA